MTVFTPELFGSVETRSGAAPSLLRFVLAGVNTAVQLGSGLKQPRPP